MVIVTTKICLKMVIRIVKINQIIKQYLNEKSK